MKLPVLVAHVRERFTEAVEAFNAYESYMVHMPADDELEFLEESFVSSVTGLKVALLAGLEAAGLNHSRDSFRDSFLTFENIAETRYVSFNAVMYSPVLEMCRDYVRALAAVAGEEPIDTEAQDRQKLEQILSSTAVFIRDQGLNPANEADVRQAMRSVFRSVFPDTVPEVPIAKVTKTYKPDFGVPALRAAVEYKFCASASEVAKALGGIYEDIHGYAGSRDWEWFYAVLYLTEPFIAPQHAEAEFRLGGVTKRWKPIVVVGTGGRSAGRSQGRARAAGSLRGSRRTPATDKRYKSTTRRMPTDDLVSGGLGTKRNTPSTKTRRASVKAPKGRKRKPGGLTSR
jgi:hypothetical protein